MNHEPPVPARERLAYFLSAHPGAEDHYSLSDIARELGVSRERVRQLLPGWRIGQGPPSSARALQMFLAAHPEAMRSAARGGMTLKAIALAIGRDASEVGRTWRRLELPDRRSMALSPREKSKRTYERNPAKHLARVQPGKIAHPEQAREISRVTRRRWLAKVLREKVCVILGSRFRGRTLAKGTTGGAATASCARGAAACAQERRRWVWRGVESVTR